MSKPIDAFAALAHPMRREILERLRDRPGLSAGEIAAAFPQVSRAAVSKHLGVLRRARLVRSRTRGRESLYTSTRARSPRSTASGWQASRRSGRSPCDASSSAWRV